MQALTLTARQGWRWFGDGFRIFRRNPPLLAFIVFAYWALMALVSEIPLLGPALATLFMPLFSVSLMNACRDLDHGEKPGVLILFSGFRQQPRSLFVLGAGYLAAMLAILALSSLADDGVLLRWMFVGEPPSEEALTGGAMLGAAQIALLLILPLLMAYWYAPVLVAWHSLPPARALFYSLFACLRNWRAFLGYSAATALFATLLPGVALGLLAALLPDGSAVVARVLTLPFLLLLAPTLFASFYASYRDVFVDEPGDPASGAQCDATDASDSSNSAAG
jgi:hypothetical protein